MKPARKAALAAGATVASIVLSTGKAEAEPVVSSWYGPGFEGNATASGEVFRADGHTAAHPSLPFGTQLLVTYGGRQAVVRVIDRGPFADGRGLDLSRAAAETIGLTTAGADTVDVQALGLAGYETRSSERNPRLSASARNWGAESLREHPHLKVLGASFTPYTRSSTTSCQEPSMVTPTAGAPSMSMKSAKTEVVGAVARCSANTISTSRKDRG